jgi:MFS family permease
MLWKNRVFRKMFLAYSFSTLGDWFDMIAISVLLGYIWHASPLIIALLPFAYALPSLLVGQIAGVLADRWHKLRLMIIADVCSTILTVLLVFAPSIPWVMALLTLRSFCGVFQVPAQQALTRQVVAEEHLLKASTWNNMVNQGAKIMGPIFGASVISFVSPKMCLAINACSFFLSAIILLTVRLVQDRKTVVGDQIESHSNKQTEKQTETSLRFRESWREGWQIFFQNRVLLATLVYSFFGLMAVQLIDFQGVVLLRDFAPDEVRLSGWTIAGSGAGAVLVMILLSRLQSLRSYGWLFGGGYLLIGLGFAGNGLLHPGMSYLVPILASCLIGIGNGMFMLGFSYLIQKEPPEGAVGRVSSIFNSFGSIVFLVAPLTGGWIVKTYGATTTYWIIGLTIGAIGFVGIVLQRFLWGNQRQEAVQSVSS